MYKHIHFIHQWQFSIRAAAHLSTRCDDGFIITNIMMKSDLHPIQFQGESAWVEGENRKKNIRQMRGRKNYLLAS